MDDLFSAAALTGRTLARGDIRNLCGTPRTLAECDLEEADLSGLDLSGWQFERCNFRKADFGARCWKIRPGNPAGAPL